MHATTTTAPFSEGPRPPWAEHPLPKVARGRRVFVFYSLAVLMTGCASLLFADLLWRFGWSTSRTVLLILFSILFLLASVGCMHGIYGFVLRRTGERRRITQLGDYRSRRIDGTSTALVFPIYNESVRRVCEGLRTTYESLARTGHLAQFDFFILSDSSDPDKWVEEEHRWFELVRDLNALGRIYYRRRLTNEGKKSGNIRDFLSVWGRRYRYFVVLDADSIMSGTTLVDLVKLMETHPTVGLIQTAPAVVNANSAFGRMQQFANRLYGPLFNAGLNFWSQDGGNYWGHNAIIRTDPFMEFCDLPKLPGKKPFGGQILSHDFVEAALLRKENWEVWFAWDLEGSYEEGPPTIIDNAQRDRRWCQGNLQHFLLLFARGLRGISRIHLTLGILGYLAAPLWLLFLITGTYLLWYRKQTGLSTIVVDPFTPFIHLSGASHALLMFCLAMVVIFLPKVLSLVDLALDPERRRAFGGFGAAATGAFLETIFSALHAPLQMLLHTKFVVATLFGVDAHWGTQRRAARGTTWGTALRYHWGHTALGLGWGTFSWSLDPTSFWWFVPVLSGMVFSIPLSVLTSRETLGRALGRARLFLTPEETVTPHELARIHERLLTDEAFGEATALAPNHGLRDAILDPYVNAIHVSLLREKQLNPHYAEAFAALASDCGRNSALGEKLLAEGPHALTAAEQICLLSNADTLTWLHHQAWMRSAEQLAEWWRAAIRRYNM
ncbi:MAG: glucans biosynthesis glucosyltransferase MdoH [Verrucomicrobiota bacterium]|nr:glucans biosynthesis glucosyltransferase MdoH [Verrucomicrobiota bacterium]